ncbi:MAG: NAD-binding protein, partial [Deltaproteobacteria bacterium]|nr:NAD-binding protein [Deltaproteobacteria bacterium]
MQIGIIGLGRMGMNMSRRLQSGGHEVVVFDRLEDNVKLLVHEGAIGAFSIDELVAQT